MGSNKICIDASVVVATTPVLTNSGVPNSFKSILQIKKTEKKESCVTFADVTKHGKCKSTNFKSWIPKSTVFDVSAQVPSLEDFPPLAGVRKKKNVKKELYVIKTYLPRQGRYWYLGGRPYQLYLRRMTRLQHVVNVRWPKDQADPRNKTRKGGASRSRDTSCI